MWIDANDTWAVWSCLTLVAAAGLILERTAIGSRISGAVISILFGMLISNIGIAPHQSQVYDLVWSWLLPLGIPLLLLDANLRRILTESGPMLLAFLIGAVGAFLGNLLAFVLIPLGDQAWKLASVLTASYIGGSVNFFATAGALGLEDDAGLLAAGAAADNLAMALFFVLLFLLPSIPWLRKRYPDRGGVVTDKTELKLEAQAVTTVTLATAIAVAFLLCALGRALGAYFNFAGGDLLCITALSVLVATVCGRWVRHVRGHREVGMGLMQIFFVVIGLSADVGQVLQVAPLLFLYLAVMLSVHLAVLLFAGRWAKLDLRELALASNCNCGGPTTAAAMAISQRWHGLVVPAILCGTLGYACANFVGLFMAWLIGP